MKRRVWRQFKPRVILRRSKVIEGDLFALAMAAVRSHMTEAHNRVDVALEEAMSAAVADPSSVQLLTSLILQSPRAARAQEQMDKHPHGYRDKQARLYQLIDFNDTFVATVLSLPTPELATFAVRLQDACDAFCRQIKSRSFTDEQYEAIVHGLSREIAVYRGAVEEGYDVEMTPRADDAFGIDMHIIDESSGRYINVDVKTSSSFHFRLLELVREGRISPHDQIDAETKGYWEVVNRRDGQSTKIILLRVSQDELGRVINFSFERPELLGKRLRRIFEMRSLVLHDS